ncbi:hypothetical protein MKL09_14370 [Methylobacterium sp. J-048]|uniref:hypothetical protein n=1 Tax=Methylobacterium sp. J-048 TaxID=2836635 RepID=UPI001FBC08CD|nr:hypothetical protein [Methylobacterium sp. J-048]MCJ2057736.1 hypothetical protein [Methylobacterium sp. J-048]
MGVIGWILAALGAIAVATLSRLCSDEFKAWRPWITNWLIDRAVSLLPEELRDRFSEEWRSHIEETPGDLGKLVAAVGFAFASRRMGNRPSLLARVSTNYKSITSKIYEKQIPSYERARLSAAWLNTIASGVVSAGSCGSLLACHFAPDPKISALQVITITITALGLGATLHLVARALRK